MCDLIDAHFPSWLNLEAIFTLGTLDVYALTSLSAPNGTRSVLGYEYETLVNLNTNDTRIAVIILVMVTFK